MHRLEAKTRQRTSQMQHYLFHRHATLTGITYLDTCLLKLNTC